MFVQSGLFFYSPGGGGDGFLVSILIGFAERHLSVPRQIAASTQGIPLTFEAHVDLKKRIPGAIGLIRTGDITQYANMILMSGRV